MTWHSNIWTAGTWHSNIWVEYGLGPRLGFLEKILIDMEKHSIGEYLFEVGVAEPGLDNFRCPLRTILSKMEKKQT